MSIKIKARPLFCLFFILSVFGMNASKASVAGTICQLGEVCNIEPGPFGAESTYLFQGSEDQKSDVTMVCHLESESKRFNVAVYAGDDLILDRVEQGKEDRPHHFTLNVDKTLDVILHGHFKKLDSDNKKPQGAVKFMSILDAGGQVACSLNGAQGVVNTVS